MPGYSEIKFRDTRTGRFRKAAPFESNKAYRVDTLSKGLANFVFKTSDALAEHAKDFAADLVKYAKTNAPWQDQTGAAREGLNGEVDMDNDGFTITLAHTVEYGIWLEIRWGGKYAIIIPTVETMGPQLWNKVQGILGDIVYYE